MENTNEEEKELNPNASEESTPAASSEPRAPQIEIDQQKLDDYLQRLRSEQNLPMAIVGGLGAAVASAIVWAAITVSTNFQIGYMAVAVGFLVGFTVKFMGKGMDQVFGFVGAGLALIGCLLGNFFSIVAYAAQAEGLGYIETLGLIDYGLIPDIMMETFHPMDLLFYGLALYEGYKFSFRTVSEEDIILNARK